MALCQRDPGPPLPDPLLRLCGVVGASAPPPEAEVARLIRQLGSNSFREREAATRRLEAIGEPALGRLRRAAQADDAEVRRGSRELVAAIERRLHGALLCFGH